MEEIIIKLIYLYLETMRKKFIEIINIIFFPKRNLFRFFIVKEIRGEILLIFI